MLADHDFAVVDLRQYAEVRGLLERGEKASLDALVKKLLGAYLEKEESVRKSNEWERKTLSAAQVTYTALDVLALRELFKHMSQTKERSTL